MASTTSRPTFLLSPHQQNLLFAALNSNNVTTKDREPSRSVKESTTMPSDNSPTQHTPGSGVLNDLEESPYIDYDYDFDPDGSLDYDISNISQDQMIGKLPGSSSDGDVETHDKRTHPDDEENEVDGGGKRREGDERGSKKPGRKPLTSEPTSKRKAQNRAAQRAFRERKERHLKDLETKVQDLEKASESANQENSILRAQLEKMAVELKEYKKRLLLPSNGRSPSFSASVPPYLSGKGLSNAAVNNPNEVNFQFEFPKFGRLPGPPSVNALTFITSKTTSPPVSSHRSSTTSIIDKTGSLDQTSPNQSSVGSSNTTASPESIKETPLATGPVLNDMSEFSGLFSPSLLESVNKDFSFDHFANSGSTDSTSSSTTSANGQNSTGQNTSYNSPSDSCATSNHGVSSSCGTSPEPGTYSPSACKPLESSLGIIGEEHSTGQIQGETSFCAKLSMACGNPNNPIPRTMSEGGITPGIFHDPSLDVNSIDWFAQQNGNQFDPQLFADYREPQNNILAGNGLYDDSFFSEAFTMPDLNNPLIVDTSPVPPKKDLVAEIDDRLNADEEVVPGEAAGQMLTCNNMWEKLQACPSVQSGEIDMDSLCSQLQQKAKCSGDGPVIDEKDFKSVIESMFTKDT